MTQTQTQTTTHQAGKSAGWLEDLHEREKSFVALWRDKAADEDMQKALCDVLAGYEAAERPWVLLALERFLSPEAFWRALHRHWTSFSQVPHGRFSWLFGRRRPAWKAEYLSARDAAIYAALPETATVYRAQEIGSRVALSWSLDRRHAETLAGAPRGALQAELTVLEALVSKCDIAGLYSADGEIEILVFSASLAKRRLARAVGQLRPRD